MAHCDDVDCSTASLETVDPFRVKPTQTSIVVGADGLPIISYQGDGNLMAAHCENPCCSAASLSVIVAAWSIGPYTSIAIGTDGLPIVSYNNGGLSVAHCDDAACSTAKTTRLNNTVLDLPLPMVIGSDGLPLITYNIESRPDDLLMVAHCDDIECSSATRGRLLAFGITTRAKGSALAIGADGLPVVSFDGKFRLVMARCPDVTCGAANSMPDIVPEPSGPIAITRFAESEFASIAIGTDDLPVISYQFEGRLYVAHCDDAACSSGSIGVTPIRLPVIETQTSIAIGSDGLPIISYRDSGNEYLKVAHCDDATCSGVTVSIVDDDFSDGGPTSIAIGSDGFPVITYPGKVAHCNDVKCSSE